MRLFVAIDLPVEARVSIASIEKRLATRIGERDTLRLVRPEQLHLTLVFAGEVDEARAQAMVLGLAADLEQEPFDLVLGGLGVFPPAGAPRALWLGVVGGAKDVAALQLQVVDRLEPLGVLREGRPFSPHLTLARWRRRSRPSDAGRALADPVITRIHVPVSAVTLYQSRVTSSGSTYTVLQRSRLRASGPR